MSLVPLICPTTRCLLHEAEMHVLEGVRRAVELGQITRLNGSKLVDKPSGLLLDSEMQIAYPITGGIPQLLPELAISLAGLNPGNSVE